MNILYLIALPSHLLQNAPQTGQETCLKSQQQSKMLFLKHKKLRDSNSLSPVIVHDEKDAIG